MPSSAISTPGSRTRNNAAELVPFIVFLTAVIVVKNRMPAWACMWALALSIFAGLKWLTWCRARDLVPHSPERSLAYLLAWPGMDAKSFLDLQSVPIKPSTTEWVWGFVKTAIGVALLWVAAPTIPAAQELLRAWIGLLGLIFLLHFGAFHLISLFWRSFGIDAEPIMAAPLKSASLSEFWGKRWNLGFRQLAHQFIFRPLHHRIGVAAAGFAVFLVSGLIHDLVISLPARGGYGLPTAYFALQGLGVTLERSRVGHTLTLQRGFCGWLFMLVMTAGPAFWLFHPPFVLRVIIPFLRAIHAI